MAAKSPEDFSVGARSTTRSTSPKSRVTTGANAKAGVRKKAVVGKSQGAQSQAPKKSESTSLTKQPTRKAKASTEIARIEMNQTSGALQSLDGGVRMVEAAAQDIGSFIRAQRQSAEVSLRQLSDLAGVSNPYLSQIERGLRRPSAEVLGQIAKGLRVSAEVLYVRAGILEQREPSPVRDAILTDPQLSERQRHALLEVYQSFCRNNVDGAVDVVAADK